MIINWAGRFAKLVNANSIVIRYTSVKQANQRLVEIHNNAAHEELVEINNRLTSRKS